MIVVPFIDGMLRDQTREWAVANDAMGCRLGPEDDAYYKALRQWWDRPGDLVIVEQDIVPAPGAVDEMFRCPFSWCTCPFPIHDSQIVFGQGLGCTKLSEGLRRAHPYIAIEAGQPQMDPEPEGAWWVLDVRLARLLLAAGYAPHGHAEAEHLH